MGRLRRRDGGLQGDEDGMARGGRVGEALVEHGAPGGEQARGGGGVGYFVAEVVGDAAEGVDALEVGAERGGKEEGGDVEVFVVGGGEGLAPGLGFGERGACGGREVEGGRADEAIVEWGGRWVGEGGHACSSTVDRGRGFRGRAGEDGGLDVGCDAVGWAREHAAKDVGEVFDGGGAGEEVLGAEAAGGDEIEGAARGCRGVVEAGLEGEVGVVDEVGVERDGGAAGRAAEEVDEAALARHLHGPLPGFGSSDGFEDDVGAAAFGGEGAGGGDGVGDVGDAKNLFGAEVARGGDLVFALDDGDDVEAEQRGGVDEEQADGAGAEDDGGLVGCGAGLFEAADDAGEGFGEGGVLEGDGVGDAEGVLLRRCARGCG